MDNIEPACCFDASAYTGAPDAAPAGESVPVPEIIRRLDALYDSGREGEAGDYLVRWRETAAARGDWRGELSVLSELMGHYRRSRDEEKGLAAVEDGLALVAVVGHGMVRSKGTAARVFAAIYRAGINVRMIDQGSSELNIILGVDESDYADAIRAIYREFMG